MAQQHLACVAGLRDVELVAVCDLSAALAESAAERYRVKRWYTDHARLLAETKPDVVHITTQAASHFRLTEDCLKADAHVFF